MTFRQILEQFFGAGQVVCDPPQPPALVLPNEDQWDPPMESPKNRREAYQVFGNPGVGKPDKKWARSNIVYARDLPGKWKGNGRNVHKLVEPFLREALSQAHQIGELENIGRLGCYVFRHQRHDPNLPLSYHSFGCAIDINPKENRAWYRTDDEGLDFKKRRGNVPQPFEGHWSDIWPKGMSEDLVVCFENAGWKWGGRWNSFVDPMHFQLVGGTVKT